MTKLSAEASSILNQGRRGMSPPPEAKARIFRSIEAEIAGETATKPDAGASLVSSTRLWLMGALLLGIGATWYLRGRASQGQSAVVVADADAFAEVAAKEVSVIAAPAPVSAHPAEVARKTEAVLPIKSEAASAWAPRASLDARPNKRRPKAKSKTKKGAIDSPASSLTSERALIAQAQLAIRSKNYKRALSLLAEHRKLFLGGILSPERQAATAIATCLDAQEGGKAMAKRFLALHRSSPLAGRVRRSCSLDL